MTGTAPTVSVTGDVSKRVAQWFAVKPAQAVTDQDEVDCSLLGQDPIGCGSRKSWDKPEAVGLLERARQLLLPVWYTQLQLLVSKILV